MRFICIECLIMPWMDYIIDLFLEYSHLLYSKFYANSTYTVNPLKFLGDVANLLWMPNDRIIISLHFLSFSIQIGQAWAFGVIGKGEKGSEAIQKECRYNKREDKAFVRLSWVKVKIYGALP